MIYLEDLDAIVTFGGFFSLTDISEEEFGEGSFDEVSIFGYLLISFHQDTSRELLGGA